MTATYYLLALSIGLCVVYAVLMLVFSLFFTNRRPTLRQRSLYSIVVILLMSLVINALSMSIPDPDVSNRVLHAFGGGFLSFFICFLVVKDAELRISKFQFFVFSVLIVTAMGVANEIVEFFLQRYFSAAFSETSTDTWLDLISNTVGALIGAACFVPFVKSGNR